METVTLKKKIAVGIDTDYIGGIFNSILGVSSNTNYVIIFEKHKLLLAKVGEILACLTGFVQNEKFYVYFRRNVDAYEQLMDFINTGREGLKTLQLEQLPEVLDPATIQECNTNPEYYSYLIKHSGVAYYPNEANKNRHIALKVHPIVTESVSTTKIIQEVAMLELQRKPGFVDATKRKDLDRAELKEQKARLKADIFDQLTRKNYIINTDGGALKLLSYCGFDFKSLINELPEFEETILGTIKCLYEFGVDIARTLFMPDIDTNEFSEHMNNAILELEGSMKQYADAFKLIKKSVGRLKENFSDYWRDFAVTGNPLSIMEAYVMDLSTGHDKGTNVQVKKQLMGIVTQIRNSKKRSGANAQNRAVVDKLAKFVELLNV